MNRPSTEGFDAIIMCDPRSLMWIGWVGRSAKWVCPPLPVLVPDVIFREATDGERLGSNPLSPVMVREWAQTYPDDIRIVPTTAGTVIDTIQSHDPGELTRIEAAGWEVIYDYIGEVYRRRAITSYATPGLRSPWPNIWCEPWQLSAFLPLFIGSRTISGSRGSHHLRW